MTGSINKRKITQCLSIFSLLVNESTNSKNDGYINIIPKYFNLNQKKACALFVAEISNE